MRTHHHPLSVILIVFAAISSCAKSPTPPAFPAFFFQKWGNDFSLRPLENGDTLSIGAVFSDGRQVFIYNQAAGAMVTLDSMARIVSRTALQGSVRGTYAGDDFVVQDSVFIFVNSVDKRLDYYSRKTGKLVSTVPLPVQALAGQSKRSYRLINRIFIVENRTFIGNEHVVFDCAGALKKSLTGADYVSAPGNDRLALFAPGTRWVLRGGQAIDALTGKKAVVPSTHFSIGGKRLFVLKDRLFAVQATREGVKIIGLK